jgi:hypothetical protein
MHPCGRADGHRRRSDRVRDCTRADPAPIENHLNPAMPNLMVLIRKDADIFSIAARLVSAYAVQPRVLPAIRMLMLTPVTEALVERLRCEPDIELLSYDVPTSIN